MGYKTAKLITRTSRDINTFVIKDGYLKHTHTVQNKYELSIPYSVKESGEIYPYFIISRANITTIKGRDNYSDDEVVMFISNDNIYSSDLSGNEKIFESYCIPYNKMSDKEILRDFGFEIEEI